ncbi:MAG: hypothetical protein E7069_06855 [Bacteroidales bacterium]|jgi:hypothetical protein|nr:hypothetical protein [Bacteroidales bacterium]
MNERITNACTQWSGITNPAQLKRSLKDANAIKYYNGGRYLKLIKEEISTEKSESVKRTFIKRWKVYQNNTNKPPFNYVERICKEKD